MAGADLFLSRSGDAAALLDPRRRGGAAARLVQSPLVARAAKQQPAASFGPARQGFRTLAQPRSTGRPGKENSFNMPSSSLHPSFYRGLLENGLSLINDTGFRTKPCKSLRPVSPGRSRTHDAGGVDGAMRYRPEQRRARLRCHPSPRSVRRPARTNGSSALGGY